MSNKFIVFYQNCNVLIIIFDNAIIIFNNTLRLLRTTFNNYVNFEHYNLVKMNTDKYINSVEELEEILKNETAVLLYFSTTSCNVGESLKPKVVKLLADFFQKMKFFNIDLNFAPEVAATCNAFVEPTLIIYFEGKETIRKSRNIGINELEKLISRPYKLIFE